MHKEIFPRVHRLPARPMVTREMKSLDRSNSPLSATQSRIFVIPSISSSSYIRGAFTEKTGIRVDFLLVRHRSSSPERSKVDLAALDSVHLDPRGPLGGGASLDACARSLMIAGISSPNTSPKPKALPSQVSSSARSGRGAWA